MYNKHQIQSVTSILKNNKTNYWTGTENKKFEKEFSKYHNTRFSISVSNGSVALEIALKSLNLKKNDIVIVSPRSFIISASCVLNVGLKPIFADVDKNGNLSIEGISKAFKENRNIKAIIVVHLNGLACDLDPILKFIKKKKLFLIEDCSQAHGAKYKGKVVGSFGNVSIWSFCQDKIISTGGEGGMISTNSKQIWQKCWSYKDHGKNFKTVFYKKHKPGFRWLHDQLGSNYRMTEIQATLGRYQLRYLDRQLNKRKKIANLYINGLRDFWTEHNLLIRPHFICTSCPLKNKIKKQCNSCRHAFYRLNLFINPKKINQTKLLNQLSKKKIASVNPCPEIYREKIFKKLKFYPNKRLPNARLLGKMSFVLPINPFKSLFKIKMEIKVIKKILFMYL